ncbi:hypothetical protein AAFF_G00038660 [Aldrovandia affinis]|uniref:Uncharacterized protein n=1 Tax=Aldrovandia affinis TaxID=143900 RepID=A0AAD7T584_9TELE|nr:hypothetical protein AAFF_G00038660 [Aldrovandia affinis]
MRSRVRPVVDGGARPASDSIPPQEEDASLVLGEHRRPKVGLTRGRSRPAALAYISVGGHTRRQLPGKLGACLVAVATLTRWGGFVPHSELMSGRG